MLVKRAIEVKIYYSQLKWTEWNIEKEGIQHDRPKIASSRWHVVNIDRQAKSVGSMIFIL